MCRYHHGMRAFLLPFLAALSMVQIGLGASANSKVYALKDGYVDANGVLIYYTELGQGSPLVILHGGPGAHPTITCCHGCCRSLGLIA
jgi:hypothetical protein